MKADSIVTDFKKKNWLFRNTPASPGAYWFFKTWSCAAVFGIDPRSADLRPARSGNVVVRLAAAFGFDFLSSKNRYRFFLQVDIATAYRQRAGAPPECRVAQVTSPRRTAPRAILAEGDRTSGQPPTGLRRVGVPERARHRTGRGLDTPSMYLYRSALSPAIETQPGPLKPVYLLVRSDMHNSRARHSNALPKEEQRKGGGGQLRQLPRTSLWKACRPQASRAMRAGAACDASTRHMARTDSLRKSPSLASTVRHWPGWILSLW